MPPHSFKHLQDAILLLSLTLPSLSYASGPGVCGDPSFGDDILRFELSPNAWTTNASLSDQRGAYLWVGKQYEGGSQKPPGQPYPVVAALSTAYNQTYISTTAVGLKDAPCPNSYSYNDDYDSMAWNSWNEYTFNGSFTCHGFYNLSTSAPIYLETSSNFTGSPENTLTNKIVKAAEAKYGTTAMELVLPEHYYDSQVQGGIMSVNSFYSSGRGPLLGFVKTSEQQVLGLGFNSSFLKFFYESGRTASRSIGLYYGVPSAAGSGLERNGTLVLGGYSTSRVQGGLLNETYPIGAWKLARQCPWEVDISSISSSGEDLGKFPFAACVEPQESQLVLPSSSYSALNALQPADLTITLSNGLNITIPSSLVSFREETDADQSPILGAPFLSQTYIFADYQAKTLSVGHADNELAYTQGRDVLQCVQHNITNGDLGWAVGSSEAYAAATKTASNTATATGAESTGKKNGSARGGVEMVIALVAVVLSVGLLL